MRNSGTTRIYLDVELDDGTELEVQLEVTIEADEPDVNYFPKPSWTIEAISGIDIPKDAEAELNAKLADMEDQIEALALENLE